MTGELLIERFEFKIKKEYDLRSWGGTQNIIIPFFNNKDPKTIWGEISKFHFSRTQFHESTKKNGEFDIFVCICGDAFCDYRRGLFKVTHEDERIIWDFLNPGANPNKVIFSKKIYQNFDKKLSYYEQFDKLVTVGYLWSKGHKLDPVCFRIIDHIEERYSCKYKSETYEFCSKDCKKAFEDEPENYNKNIDQKSYYFLI